MPPPHLLNPILLLLTTLPLTYGCQRDWSALHKRAHYTHLPTARLTKRSTNTSFPPALTDHESLLLNAFEEDALRTWSHYYTHGNHLGSYNKSQAEWTRDRWTENGLDDAWLEEFPIYVTYPERSRLWLTVEGKNGTGNGSTHEANLVEDVLEEDDTSGYPDLIPAYHAMSASGSVRGEYVYVGYVCFSLHGVEAVDPDCTRFKSCGTCQSHHESARSDAVHEHRDFLYFHGKRLGAGNWRKGQIC